MQPGWGISKKTNAHRHVVLAVIFLAVMQYGCGDNNSTAKQSTLDGSGNKAVMSSNAGTVVNPLATEQKAAAPQSNDSEPLQGTTTARTDDGTSSSAASHGPGVSGVENVSSPFGPFPPESNTVSQQVDPDAATPPPEPPETPRSPFGPFPTSQ